MEQPATQPDPLVIEGLSFRYQRRDTFAIDDVTLTVKAGEIILIAGTNLLFAAILLPLVVIAYESIQKQSGC